jgi:hypothetical protein
LKVDWLLLISIGIVLSCAIITTRDILSATQHEGLILSDYDGHGEMYFELWMTLIATCIFLIKLPKIMKNVVQD